MSFKDRFLQIPPVTKNLLIINVLVYLVCMLFPRVGFVAEQYGALYYITSSQFSPWQLVSYMFLHANFTHLFFNMFSLWMFGPIIERALGSPRYLFYYISCGIGAALIQEGVFALMLNHYASLFDNSSQLCELLRGTTITYGDLYKLGVDPADPAVQAIVNLYHTPTVGASGAIYGVLLAFGYLFPYMQIFLLFPPIPMRARTAVIVFACIELALGVFQTQADTVAHFAHLGGMLVGFIMLYWWKKSGTIRPYF